MMAKTNVSIFFRSRNRIIHAVCQIRHNLSIKRSKEFFKEFFLHLPTLRIWISAKESWPPLKWMSAKLSIETNKGFFLFEERRGGDVKWKYSTQNILCCREINDIVIGNETRFPERKKKNLGNFWPLWMIHGGGNIFEGALSGEQRPYKRPKRP